MEANDMIFYENKDEQIYAGGFSVNSVMMKNGISPILTLNTSTMNTDKVSDLFDNIVVPNWAFYLPAKTIVGGTHNEMHLGNNKYESDEDEEDDVIDDDLHNKLLDLVKPDIKKAGKKTRRNINKRSATNKKKTKRNK